METCHARMHRLVCCPAPAPSLCYAQPLAVRRAEQGVGRPGEVKSTWHDHTLPARTANSTCLGGCGSSQAKLKALHDADVAKSRKTAPNGAGMRISHPSMAHVNVALKHIDASAASSYLFQLPLAGRVSARATRPRPGPAALATALTQLALRHLGAGLQRALLAASEVSVAQTRPQGAPTEGLTEHHGATRSNVPRLQVRGRTPMARPSSNGAHRPHPQHRWAAGG